MSSKRKRFDDDDADGATELALRPLKMARLDTEQTRNVRHGAEEHDRYDTQMAAGDPRSGMEDSDVQEESIQESAILRRQNRALAAENKALRSLVERTLRRTLEMEARVSHLERFTLGLDPQGPIAELPSEMIHVIFQSLPLVDLLNCESVCSSWKLALVQWISVLDLSPYYDAVNNSVVENLSKYRNLESLCLARCKDVTDPALTLIVSSFPKLRHLDVFSCQVTDFIQLHALPRLISLRIGDCAEISDATLKLLPPQVRTLRLEWLLAVLNEGLANIAHMTNLVALTLEQNDNMSAASMALPEALAPTLRRFRVIRQGAYADACLESLAKFKNLEKLSLYWVGVVGHGFDSFNDMPNLRRLSLRRCYSLSNGGFDAIARRLSHLKSLEVKGMTQMTRDGFRRMNRMTNLTDLRLRCATAIVDLDGVTDLEFLSNMRLKRLELIDGGALTDLAIKKIVDTQEFTLERLLLSDCHLLHSSDLQPLRRLRNVRSLVIEKCAILTEEKLQVQLLEGGGVEFTSRTPDVIEVDEDDSHNDNEEIIHPMDLGDDFIDELLQNPGPVPTGPFNNADVFGIPDLPLANPDEAHSVPGGSGSTLSVVPPQFARTIPLDAPPLVFGDQLRKLHSALLNLPPAPPSRSGPPPVFLDLSSSPPSFHDPFAILSPTSSGPSRPKPIIVLDDEGDDGITVPPISRLAMEEKEEKSVKEKPVEEIPVEEKPVEEKTGPVNPIVEEDVNVFGDFDDDLDFNPFL